MGRRNLTYTTRTKLAQAREAAGLTQQQVATEANLSISTYQAIEYGSDPHLSSMVAICDVLSRKSPRSGRRRRNAREIFLEVFYEHPQPTESPDTPPHVRPDQL